MTDRDDAVASALMALAEHGGWVVTCQQCGDVPHRVEMGGGVWFVPMYVRRAGAVDDAAGSVGHDRVVVARVPPGALQRFAATLVGDGHDLALILPDGTALQLPSIGLAASQLLNELADPDVALLVDHTER